MSIKVSVTRRRLLGDVAGGLAMALCASRGALAAASFDHPRVATGKLPSREFFIPYTPRAIGNGGLAPGQIALTFDDGPHAALTPTVLDTLRRYGVRATFFVIGRNAAAHPDIVRRALAEGHSVGTHSWSHPYLTGLADEAARTEIVRAQDTVQGIDAGGVPFFRLPYGAGLHKPTLLKTLTDLGLYNFYWNMDPKESSRGAARGGARPLPAGAAARARRNPAAARYASRHGGDAPRPARGVQDSGDRDGRLPRAAGWRRGAGPGARCQGPGEAAGGGDRQGLSPALPPPFVDIPAKAGAICRTI